MGPDQQRDFRAPLPKEETSSDTAGGGQKQKRAIRRRCHPASRSQQCERCHALCLERKSLVLMRNRVRLARGGREIAGGAHRIVKAAQDKG
jgi:hypothetical protein